MLEAEQQVQILGEVLMDDSILSDRFCWHLLELVISCPTDLCFCLKTIWRTSYEVRCCLIFSAAEQSEPSSRFAPDCHYAIKCQVSCPLDTRQEFYRTYSRQGHSVTQLLRLLHCTISGQMTLRPIKTKRSIMTPKTNHLPQCSSNLSLLPYSLLLLYKPYP
jgi:hypothetical protein